MTPTTRWLVIAMMVVGTVSVCQAQTQDPRQDLAIVSLRVIDPGPSWVEGEAVHSSIEVVVRNNGNVPAVGYRMHYTWIDGNGERPLNEDDARSFDVREETLEPRTERTLTFPWRLQDGQTGTGDVKAVVQWTSGGTGDSNPADNTRAITTMVKVRALQVAAVGGPLLVHPGEVVFVRFQIFNHGNVPEPVELTAPASMNGAARRLDPQLDVSQLTVPANGNTTATLFIHYPDRNDPTPFSTRLPLRVATSYARVIEVETPFVSSTDDGLRLDAYAHTLSVTTTGTTFVDPGSRATLHLLATNTGEENDTYTLDAEAGPDWSLEVQPRRIALLPGESVPVTVIAEPNRSVPEGAGTDAVVNLRSEHPLAPISARALLRVSGPVPGVVADSPQQAYVGDAWILSIRAQNQGNVAIQGDGTLHVRARFSDGSTRELVMTMGPMQAGGEQQIDAPFGELLQGGPVWYSLQWQAPGDIFSPLHEGSFTVNDPHITITSPVPLEGMPGESVSYRVTPHLFHLFNSGDAAESVHLAIASRLGSAAILGPTVIHLDAGESRAVAVEHTLPRPSLAALEDTVQLMVSSASRPKIEWNATVATSIRDTQSPMIRVGIRPADWGLTVPMPIAAAVEDDGMVATVRVRVDAPDDTTRTVHLVPDASGTWRTIMQFGSAGNHTLTLQATDAAGNSAEGSTWRVTVHAAPVPRITPDLPLSGSWDLAFPLKIAVESTIGVSVLHFALTQEANPVVQGDAPVIEGNATIVLSGARPGSAELLLTAIDDAGTRSTVTVVINLTRAVTAELGDNGADPQAENKSVPLVTWPYLLGPALVMLVWRRQP